MKITIENLEQLNAAVKILNSAVINMCNTSDENTVGESMITAKDYLTAIYKYNCSKFKK